MKLSIACASAATAADRSGHQLAQLHIVPQPLAAPWSLPLRSLSATPLAETWWLHELLMASAVSADHWQLQHRFGAHLAMSWLQFYLSEHADTAAASRWAYTELLNHLRTSNHQQLLKIWHYLPGINAGAGDQENYRQFCVGRAQALADHGISHTMPAATAIGIPAAAGQQAVFYWLSGTMAPDNVENPRQLSAWEYPPQYGPAAPLFSRASVVRLGEQRVLLISGTASVSGHATAYPGDCAAQTDEMLLNLRSLIDASGMPFAPQQMLLRVYLRRPDDWPQVLARMQQAGFAAGQLVPLHGEICRRDLLVELDGVLLD